MVKQLSMISLFEIFIRDSVTGKRHKLNGQKIRPQSIDNYRETLKLLKDYEVYSGKGLVINTNLRNNQRLILQQKKYWDDFYRRFSRFLFYKKGCHDNYCCHVFKLIKCFFRYMKNEKFIAIPEFYDRFYVRKEEIRIITFLPERFCFLVMDEDFNAALSSTLRRCKDVLVFGCISALRFSDLMNVRIRDIEKRGDDYKILSRRVSSGGSFKL